MEKLREENDELRRVLSVLINRELVRKLSRALKRIKSGDYISEEEFFRDSHPKSS